MKENKQNIDKPQNPVIDLEEHTEIKEKQMIYGERYVNEKRIRKSKKQKDKSSWNKMVYQI